MAEDDRFLFYAKDVGLVAEIEGIRASAMLFVRIKEGRAKLLEARPGAEPARCEARFAVAVHVQLILRGRLRRPVKA